MAIGGILFIVGIVGIASGLIQIWKAFREGLFYGTGAVKYQEDRGSPAFWFNLAFRVVMIPTGMWVIWLGIIEMSGS